MRNCRTATAVLTLILTLTLALSAPASAGIMTTDKTSPTPTPVPAAASMMSPDAPGGVTETNDAESESTVGVVLAEITAALVRSVLTLF